MKRLIRIFSSLDLSIALIAGVLFLLAVGSFTISEQSGLNDGNLSRWLQHAPLPLSWWLWGGILLLALLVVNTVVCSIDDVSGRLRRVSGVRLLAPHLVHAGFLLVILAHLLSSLGGEKEGGEVYQGMTVRLPDASLIRFDRIEVTTGPFGMATDYSASITHTRAGEETRAIIRPNHPYFAGRYGIYLKHAQGGSPPVAIVEMHVEPGSHAALAGAILFTTGTILLLIVRRGKKGLG
ncbi:MAG: cytochrome c biogenesis protein ResB [Desulfuromonadia bacterium]